MPDWNYEMGAGLADWTLFKRSCPEPARTTVNRICNYFGFVIGTRLYGNDVKLALFLPVN